MIQLTLQTLPTDPPRGEFLSPRFSVANLTESAIPAAAHDSPKNNSNAPYPDLSTISASILTGIVIGIAISYGVYVYYSGASRTTRSGKLASSEFKPQSQTSAVLVGNESTSRRHTKKFNHDAI